MFKKATVSQYVDTANPSEVLGVYNEIAFDKEAEVYRSHSATTPEVLELIKDLKVLGKGDFAQLIKWHKKLVQYKAELLEAAAGADAEDDDTMQDGEEEAAVEEVDIEELRVQEAEEMAQKVQDKQRKDKKKKHEAKMKEIKRLALNAHNLMEKNTANDDDLFDLKGTKSDAVIQALRKADDVVNAIGEDKFAQIISTNADAYYSDVSGSELSDDDDVDYETARERSIDALYEDYKKRKGIVTRTDKKKTAKALLEETKAFVDHDIEDDTDDELDALQLAKEQAGSTKAKLSMLKEDKEEDTVVAERWFGQDAFAEINIDDEQEANMRKQLEANARKRRRVEEPVEDSESDGDDEYDYDALNDDSDDDSDSDVDDEKDQRGRWLSTKKELDEDKARKNAIVAKAEKYAATQGMYGKAEQEGFEEVALSEFSDDSDARAEILALGTKMLRKKSRNAIIDAAYNRYAFNDAEDLPSWFVEDENMHNKPQMPVTKAEVQTFKQQLKEINSRPIRRLAEAVARKKKGAIRKLERAKVQANAINNQEGVSNEEKLKQIDKIYKISRAKLTAKPNKSYVVSGRSGTTNPTKNRNKNKGGKTVTVRVDTRMKADKRGEKRAEWRKKNNNKRSKK
jgi:AdoMet-dependent rRNA methyltransferase SPB1